MSTFTNSTGTVNLDFSLLFDLTTTPVLTISDTSVYSASQTNVNIFIKITRPDGIIRNFDSTSPDITGNSGSLPSFNFTLPLSSDDGQPVKGTYIIDYNLTVGSDPTVKKTKSFDLQYSPVILTLVEDLDEFSPLLKVKDTTASYNVSNFNTPSISRVFTGSIAALSKNMKTQTTTGTTTSDREYRMEETDNDGIFFDSKYSISCNTTLTYVSSSYSWVTLKDKISKTLEVDAFPPPTKTDIIDEFDQLRNLVESNDGTNQRLFDKFSADYEFVISSFNHLERRLAAGDTDDENTDIIKDIIAILRQDIPRTHTNQQLTATSTGIYSTAVSWNAISGLPVYNPFQTWNQDFSASTWTINHNLGKFPSVTIVDDTGCIVYGKVTYTNQNTITVDFSASLSGKAYLN
tara:strand:- start:2665 stop:3879 length:1215 start_codon:yes stop_codon:yes gene_type:complete